MAGKPDCGQAKVGRIERAEVIRKDIDLRDFAGEGSDALGNGAELEKAGIRLDARRRGFGDFRFGDGKTEVELVRAGECPRFDATGAEVCGEF